MPLMESDAKRSARISTESDKVLMSTSAPSPSTGSKGLKELFRRRQKSTGSSQFSVEFAGSEDSFSQIRSKVAASVQPQKLTEASTACVSSYGNYVTISGTGANALRDLFNRKYRSSGPSRPTCDGDSRSGSRRGAPGGQGQGQAPLFRFRSKKDSIREEERSPSPEPASSRQESKGVEAPRARHISGPMVSLYGTSVDRDARFRQGSSGSAPGARMRTFFDSFRQRPRTVSQDSYGAERDGATLDDTRHKSFASSKKKKFKVTPASQMSSSGRRDHGQSIGPDKFFQLYRNRANSDPKPEAIVDEAGHVRSSLLSATSSSLSKANTIHSYEPLEYIIWRDGKKGSRLFRLPKRYAETFELEDTEGGNNEELVYARFTNSHHCYELMPSSSKLVIFDTQLSVKKAFFALIHNGIRSAPLWDTEGQDFVGMLTITDFIQILQQRYYKSQQERMEELEENVISTWKEVLHGYDRAMVVVSPDESLFDAIQSLCDNKVHRLLVVDQETGNAVHILTLRRILRFMLSNMSGLPCPEFMHQTLEQLKIGSYDNIASAMPETRLIEALNMFVERRISALPIVDGDGRVVDIYAKFDVLGLVADKVYYNLDVTIAEALKNRQEEFEGVMTCLLSEKLVDIVQRIVNVGVHRLVVVNEDHRLKGILSLSDILRYLVLRPIESQKLRLAEREKETARRNRDIADQDELDFEGLDLLMQSTGPDPLLTTSLLEIKEEPKLSPDDIDASKEAEEQVVEQVVEREDRLGILSEMTDSSGDPGIPNGARS